MINILLHIYFALNLILWGMELADSRDEKKSVALIVTWIIIVLLFGSLLFGSIFIWEGIVSLSGKIDGIFQVKFFFQFNFSKFYTDVDIEGLTRINKIVSRKDNSTYKQRRFKRCVAKINKRNKFVYIPAPKTESEF